MFIHTKAADDKVVYVASYGEGPLLGRVEVASSCVKTEENCAFRAFALSSLDEYDVLPTFNVGILADSNAGP